MFLRIHMSLSIVITGICLVAAGTARGGGDFAVVLTREGGGTGDYSVMSRSDYRLAKQEAQAEAELSEMALDAAHDEWNDAERERVSKERKKQDRERRADLCSSCPKRRESARRRAYKDVSRKSFPDIETPGVITLRCVGLYPTEAAAERRLAELGRAQLKSKELGSLGSISDGSSSLSSSAQVRLGSKMPSRISKSRYASASVGKNRGKSRSKASGADIERATKLYEKHLNRLKNEPEGGTEVGRTVAKGLKKPSYLSGKSDSKVKVKRIGSSLSSGIGK